KAMLHIANVINEARHLESLGIIEMGGLKINRENLLKYKDGVIGKHTGGLKGMAQMRKVKIVQGYGKFTSEKELAVVAADGKVTQIAFYDWLIA
ncbi:dihydrolipoyl dehydrogenase, partial [Francisella tularensis subsp. holarctica]|nr:dihydrolipoyl dehydrogenase [Francisella tularensis subsp. holarctica]